MKQKFYLFAALLLLPIVCNGQNVLFQKYATLSDVKYVSISHTMLQSMSSQKNVRLGNMSLSDMADYIDNILIISSKSPSGIATIMADQKILEENTQYETLLVKNMNGQRSISLFCQNEEKSEFVLFSYTDTYTIIVINGHFTPQQFQSFFL